MRRAILRTMAALSLALTQFATGAERFTLDGTLFDTVATDLALDPYLLYAIAIAESATGVGDGNIRPTPYVFRTADGARFFTTRTEAESALAAILRVTTNVDVGMMQISLRHHPQRDPLELLDAERNLSIAAAYLKATLASTDDPVLGVGRYHSWRHDAATWYGRRVWKIYQNLRRLVASG